MSKYFNEELIKECENKGIRILPFTIYKKDEYDYDKGKIVLYYKVMIWDNTQKETYARLIGINFTDNEEGYISVEHGCRYAGKNSSGVAAYGSSGNPYYRKENPLSKIPRKYTLLAKWLIEYFENEEKNETIRIR